MRKAKIVCTIGPASASRKIIRELIKSGMDVARLNFSHGDHETHQNVAAIVREESAKQKKNVAILQDLQGIKIRLSDIDGGSAVLKAGEVVFLHPGKEASDKNNLFISYPALLKDVKTGDRIFIDDGLIKIEVIGTAKNALRAKVIEGGILRSRKGVNLPFTKTTLPAFTEKDRRDLEFGLKLGVDYVAVSFVRTAADIERVLEWAKKNNAKLPPLIAKIEKPEALNNIDEIMDIADGIMVARGDLGVEMPTEKVPMIQKMLINLANRKGKLVITATQMLESMTQHTRPTRAETGDVANAVLDGTDALMLSAETTTGKYPVESAKMMDLIIKYTEASILHRALSGYHIGNTFSEAIADGACKAAHDIGAKAIVVFTHSGFTAKLLSKLRPEVPIIAFTPDETVLRRMSIYWGTSAKLIKRSDAEILEAAFMKAIERSLVNERSIKRGDTIVFVASSPFMGKPNIIRLHRL
ncbi:MAG: pyruvate kinase [Nitrospirae bacterium GWC2_46_6]|nr:MAG: pyruvate kinase [Nitrospirae bacterium GWA2_46_11]OGW22835.1 MAG: pyruvate kinase [Nitrospirae bacterium GWC2_46_6]OGW22869.1 MAG: pyruvate kinase [Nitrospirae bacterium GWB2_47_37]HAK89721.1 pyruvate kinase [Nitrospiraceae bacterium]